VEDEYILASKHELDDLKAEIARLKGSKGDSGQSGLIEAVNRLNANIVRLTELLEGANEDMLKTYHEQSQQKRNPFEEHPDVPAPKRS
jgi:hypothetical protein